VPVVLAQPRPCTVLLAAVTYDVALTEQSCSSAIYGQLVSKSVVPSQLGSKANLTLALILTATPALILIFTLTVTLTLRNKFTWG